ncbi:hypothetical protein J2W45_002502 [Leifsonia shinshuensis]|nr:hypothetical protein [Leifsonia shinshuensis]
MLLLACNSRTYSRLARPAGAPEASTFAEVRVVVAPGGVSTATTCTSRLPRRLPPSSGEWMLPLACDSRTYSPLGHAPSARRRAHAAHPLSLTCTLLWTRPACRPQRRSPHRCRGGCRRRVVSGCCHSRAIRAPTHDSCARPASGPGCAHAAHPLSLRCTLLWRRAACRPQLRAPHRLQRRPAPSSGEWMLPLARDSRSYKRLERLSGAPGAGRTRRIPSPRCTMLWTPLACRPHFGAPRADTPGPPHKGVRGHLRAARIYPHFGPACALRASTHTRARQRAPLNDAGRGGPYVRPRPASGIGISPCGPAWPRLR